MATSRLIDAGLYPVGELGERVMSEVKRVEIYQKGLPFWDDKGVYVFYEDYAALQQKLDAVLAENVALKCGAEYFMYSPDCGFERYRSHAEAINAANEMIDDYRADAHDGWCDEVEGVCVGVILKYAQQCEEQKPSEENGFLGSVNYVMPEEQTPVTDAILNEVRAEAVSQIVKDAEGYEDEFKRDLTASEWRTLVVNYFVAFEGLSNSAGVTHD